MASRAGLWDARQLPKVGRGGGASRLPVTSFGSLHLRLPSGFFFSPPRSPSGQILNINPRNCETIPVRAFSPGWFWSMMPITQPSAAVWRRSHARSARAVPAAFGLGIEGAKRDQVGYHRALLWPPVLPDGSHPKVQILICHLPGQLPRPSRLWALNNERRWGCTCREVARWALPWVSAASRGVGRLSNTDGHPEPTAQPRAPPSPPPGVLYPCSKSSSLSAN